MVHHFEHHRASAIGWLRASVLGANDGIVSTASLAVGVASANATQADVLLAGTAGLVAGAMSMAAGEYVSVRSQADLEDAELQKEQAELLDDPEGELSELIGIYQARGLEAPLAREVSIALTKHDALQAHAKEELGLSPDARTNPVQAALVSAGAFAIGAGLPLSVAALAPATQIVPWVTLASLLSLALLGVVSARVGGAPALRAAVRVTFWGALAMLVTAAVGHWLGTGVV